MRPEDGIPGLPDSPAADIVQHLEQRVNGIERDYAEALGRLRAVTAEDVVRAARRLTLDTVYFLKPRE